MTPRYDDTHGWVGGDPRTLYVGTDVLTGAAFVRPGDNMRGVGPNATWRVATRVEAESMWQSPLHSGWRVG